MSIRKNSQNLPAIVRHPRGVGYIRPFDPVTGKRLTVYLGKWPDDCPVAPASLQAERMRIMQIVLSGRTPPTVPPKKNQSEPKGKTVQEFWTEWQLWASDYYPPLVKSDYERNFKPVLAYHAGKEVEKLSIADLKGIQDLLVSGGRTRQGVNRQIARIKAVFGAGASIGICSGILAKNLAVLRSLERKRTRAPESPEIKPLTVAEREKLLGELSPLLRDMAMVQWLSACRPGEICRISWAEIDQSGPVWIYRPAEHKTAHHGHCRAIALCRESQEILSKYKGICGPIFSPRLALRFRSRGYSRILNPGTCYDTKAYTRAIARAGERAGIVASANRLRKGRLQEVTEILDEMAAARLGGHRSARVTEAHYLAKEQIEKVVAVAVAMEAKNSENKSV